MEIKVQLGGSISLDLAHSNTHSEHPVTGGGQGLDPGSLDLAPTQTGEGGGGQNGMGLSKISNQKGVKKKQLKESEQEEQLKMSRSLISNLERKVLELENSNKILRGEVLSIPSELGGNHDINVKHGETSNFPQNVFSDRRHEQGAVQPTPSVSALERELQGVCESVRSKELEQLKSRIQNIELQVLSQRLAVDVSARGGPTNAQWVHPQGPGQAYAPSLFLYHTNVPYQIPGVPPFSKQPYVPSHVLAGPQTWAGNMHWGGHEIPQMPPQQQHMPVAGFPGFSVGHPNNLPPNVPNPYWMQHTPQQFPGYNVSNFQGSPLILNGHRRYQTQHHPYHAPHHTNGGQPNVPVVAPSQGGRERADG